MGFLVKGVKALVKGVVGIAKGVIGIVGKVAGAIFGFSVGSKTKTSSTGANNLNKTLEPETARKIVFGITAAPLDLRYWEVYGASGQQFDEVIALATHRINAVKELYLEDKLAIDAAGTVQAPFVGVLTRTNALGNQAAALAVGSGTKWNASSLMRGVAHTALKWVPDEKKLPNGIPSRYTQVIEGAFVYDPRRDSTVPGGSGTHRINDQTTWEYATLDGNGQPIGRNNALQSLWYLIGWRITNPVTGEAMLVAGRGVIAEDINLASFIAGANACEVAGYYTDMILSTEDDHSSNEDKITADGLIGRLIDPGGLWSYYANVDDTANIAVEITDADILDGVQVSWNEYKGMNEQFNSVGGKFVNGSAITLYQAFPYATVRDATLEANLGVKKRRTLDLPQVHSHVLAQRLARLALNEGQYQGEFSAGFMARAIKAQAWSVVRYTSERFGWTKLFRVWRHDISTDGGVGMLLKEIHPSIWQAGTVAAALTHGQGSGYNPAQEIPLTGLFFVQTTITGPGANPTKADGFRIVWAAPPVNVRRTEVRYRVAGTTYWETVAPVQRGTAVEALVFPLVSSATYDVEARHISVHEVEGPWSAITAYAGAEGNISYAGIVAAGNTADVGSLKDAASGVTPPRTNILTNLGIASGIVNQGGLAIKNSADFATDIVGSTKPMNNATSDRFVDTRNDNQLPSWYRANYNNRTAYEFKIVQILGVPAGLGYGKLVTQVDYGDTTGGVVKQHFTVGTGGDTGKSFVRISNDQDTAWGSWMRVYDQLQRPSFELADMIDAYGGVTRTGYRTADGVASGIVNQGALATQASVTYGNAQISGLPVGIQTQNIHPDGYLDASVMRYGALAAPTVLSLKPGEAGANVTEGRISSGFTNQGALATRGYVALGDGYVYASWGGVLTDALAVTSQGISSGFANQGALATKNAAAWEADIVGYGKPDNFASHGDNLVFNGDFVKGQTGYTLFGAIYGGVDSSWPSPGAIIFPSGTAIDSYFYVNNAEARPIYGSRLFFSFWMYATFGLAADDLWVEVLWGKPGQQSHYHSNGQWITKAAGGWEPIQLFFDVPADAAWWKIYIQKRVRAIPTGNALYFSRFRAGFTEMAADVTSQIIGTTDIVVKCDHTGVPLGGELPILNIMRFLRNGALVNSGITWAVAVVSGVINGNSANAANFFSLGTSGAGSHTINSLSSDESVCRYRATYLGISRMLDVTYRKVKAPAPIVSGSTGGGGSTGGTSGATVTDTSFAAFNATATQISDAMTVGTGANGSVNFTGSLTIDSNLEQQGTWDVGMQWQYQDAAGTWLAVGPVFYSNPDLIRAYEPPGLYYTDTTGEISVNYFHGSGFGANATWKFRLVAWIVAGTNTTLFPNGSVSVQGG